MDGSLILQLAARMATISLDPRLAVTLYQWFATAAIGPVMRAA